MKRAASRGLHVLLASVLLTATAASAAEPEREETLMVRIDHGRLTLRASGVDLRSVLQAVAREGDLTLVLAAPLEDEITIALDDVPLDEGVRRLLGSRDHVLVYEAQPHGGGASVLKQVKVGTPDGTAPSARGGLVAALGDGDSTARVAALEALANSDEISFDLLREVALRDPVPAVRTRALELLRETQADERRVEDVVLMASRNDPDREVRAAAAALLEGFER